MVPGDYNLTIYRGGTFDVDVTAKDDDGDINFSETYTSAKMYIQKAWLASADDVPQEPLFELSTTNGYIQIDGFTVRLYIPATVTVGLPFTQGVYNLVLTVDGVDPINDIILQGMINVRSGATV